MWSRISCGRHSQWAPSSSTSFSLLCLRDRLRVSWGPPLVPPPSSCWFPCRPRFILGKQRRSWQNPDGWAELTIQRKEFLISSINYAEPLHHQTWHVWQTKRYLIYPIINKLAVNFNWCMPTHGEYMRICKMIRGCEPATIFNTSEYINYFSINFLAH